MPHSPPITKRQDSRGRPESGWLEDDEGVRTRHPGVLGVPKGLVEGGIELLGRHLRHGEHPRHEAHHRHHCRGRSEGGEPRVSFGRGS
jgi:hypothetical protein